MKLEQKEELKCNYTSSKCRYYSKDCGNCKFIIAIEKMKFCGKCDGMVARHQRIRTELCIKGFDCIHCDNYTKKLDSVVCLNCMKRGGNNG